MRMRAVLAAVVLTLTMAVAALAHDLFLKPQRFRVPPNSTVRIALLNGTFTQSEAAVTWDRVLDFAVVGPQSRATNDSSRWAVRGDTSVATADIGATGTYIVGVSVAARVLPLPADAFNKYLESDGVPDILAARRASGELGRAVRERYSKHVKTLLQAGSANTNVSVPLGYPAELVTLDHPYALQPGSTLRVRALVDGRPVSNQYVLAGGRDMRGGRLPVLNTRTDSLGIARFRLSTAGTWYVKFIHMVALQSDTAADYESKWATLTFELAPRSR